MANALGRGESGYPQVRIVASMALRSHVLASFRVADYHTGETTLAKGLWETVPNDSLVVFDRNFLIKGQLVRFETSGNRHWLTRSKSNTRWAVVERLGRNDDLVELEIKEPGLPTTWRIRAIRYKRRGFPPSTLLTSLLDPEAYPASELVALYHERWEIELAYGELKTDMSHRRDPPKPNPRRRPPGALGHRSRLQPRPPRDGAAAKEADVVPTRISFVNALMHIVEVISALRSPRLALGTIPARLARMRHDSSASCCRNDDQRAYPRAVKIKMSNYARKRPTARRPK